MEHLFGYFVMLAILSVLIIVHECGHFSVARLFGFQTPVFGFGLPFGPHWVVGRKWDTEFRIHACLLGGYVAIPELGDETSATQDAFGVALKPFRKFPIWQRALVAFAGVGFNILFAYFVTITMLMSIGTPWSPIFVTKFPTEVKIARDAGIKEGDQLVALDDFQVQDSGEAVTYIRAHKSVAMQAHVLRACQPLTISITPNADGKVGMQLEAKGPTKYRPVPGSFPEICSMAWVKLWTMTYGMMDALGQLFMNLFAGVKPAHGPSLGFQDLHGVLAVIKIGSDIVQRDWSQLFMFTILISMDLAIINLVPWPALDGGHLAFMAFEAVRGRPMGERAQGEIVKWGFISLLLLMAVIMVNDLTALFTGKLDLPKRDTETPKDEGKKNAQPSAPSADQAKPDSATKGDRGSLNMPFYDFRCQKCREVFSIERSMNESKDAPCEHCGSNDVSRIWNAVIRTGGVTPDVGQGVKKSSSGGGGCGSCSSHSCGTCH